MKCWVEKLKRILLFSFDYCDKQNELVNCASRFVTESSVQADSQPWLCQLEAKKKKNLNINEINALVNGFSPFCASI